MTYEKLAAATSTNINKARKKESVMMMGKDDDSGSMTMIH
jgi:hypothetical protein